MHRSTFAWTSPAHLLDPRQRCKYQKTYKNPNSQIRTHTSKTTRHKFKGNAHNITHCPDIRGVNCFDDTRFRYTNWKLYELMCSQNGMSPSVPCHNPIMVVVSSRVWIVDVKCIYLWGDRGVEGSVCSQWFIVSWCV